jgi:hypothetical protein
MCTISAGRVSVLQLTENADGSASYRTPRYDSRYFLPPVLALKTSLPLVGLVINADDDVKGGEVSSQYSVLYDAIFSIPTHWKEWLGSMRVEEIERCNLYLLTKRFSKDANVLDEENRDLRNRVYRFYVGLLLSSRAVPAYKPVMLSGARREGEIGIRQQSDLPAVVLDIVHRHRALTQVELTLAATLGGNLDELHGSMPRSHWRLFRTLALYIQARETTDPMERIHLFCRCIDGLILPDIGKTTQQFKSRTELFIGPHHHELMGQVTLVIGIRVLTFHLFENHRLTHAAVAVEEHARHAGAGRIVEPPFEFLHSDASAWEGNPACRLNRCNAGFRVITPEISAPGALRSVKKSRCKEKCARASAAFGGRPRLG